MATFGEKLVSSGLSRPQDILQALLKAYQHSPALEAMALSEKWLDEASLLKVLTLQIEQSCCFVEAAQRAGVWNEQLKARVDAHRQLVNRQIGLELSSATGVDSRIFAIACGRFFDPQPVTPSPAAPPPPEISQVTPVFLDQDVLVDFLEIFDEGRHAFFEEKLIALEKSTAAADFVKLNEESLRQLYREFHTLKGSARFLRALLTEHLVHVAEDVLSFVQQFGDRITPQERHEIFSLLLEAVDVVWLLRMSIEESGSEETRWKEAEFQRKYSACDAALRALKSKLDGKGLSADLASVASEF